MLQALYYGGHARAACKQGRNTTSDEAREALFPQSKAIQYNVRGRNLHPKSGEKGEKCSPVFLKNSKLFQKYNLLFFRRSGEIGLTVRVRAWMFYAALTLVLGLSVGLALSLHFYLNNEKLVSSLPVLESMEREQFAALMVTSGRILGLEREADKAAEFEEKLRVMLGLAEARRNEEDDEQVQYEIGRERTIYLAYPVGRNLIRLAHRVARQLSGELGYEEAGQQLVMAEIATLKANWSVIPTIWPTYGRISSYFGWRRDPFHRGRHFHKGLDISAPVGTKVQAPASGTVTYADWLSSYGRVVEITHSPTLKTRYAHLSAILVKEGQFVLRGQVIAATGNTGRSEAPHLHYEVHKNDQEVNPLYYIVDQ